jgi:hypothetical protein
MADPNESQMPPAALGTLECHLAYLKLAFIAAQ